MISIYVQKTQARAELDAPLTSGSVGREVQFQFSADWDGLVKTAVFETNNYKEIASVPESGTVEIPADVLAYSGYQLRIGVIGKSGDGTTVIPTVYADCDAIRLGANTTPVGTPPTPSQAEHLQAQIDELRESGIGGGTTIELDTTLTQSGKAADAKAVGDALANISGANWRDPEAGEVFILDEESSGGETPDTNIPVTGISLNKSTLSLTVGNSEVLIADIAPDNATNALVNWTTSAPSVATVANDGTVTAVGVGDAVITATSGDTTNGTISASCSVACAEAESGGDTGGDSELDIPSENLMAYYDLREPLTASEQIADLSGNGIDLTLADNDGLVLGDGYISRENEATYSVSWVPAKSEENLPIDGAVTVFATISNYENKTTPILVPGGGANTTSIILFNGGVIFYDGVFNNVSANTQIDTNESYHVIAVSLETGGNEKIYINGVLKSDVAVKNVPVAGTIALLAGYQSGASTLLRLHNAAFYSSVLDDQTVATISSTLKANAGGVA